MKVRREHILHRYESDHISLHVYSPIQESILVATQVICSPRVIDSYIKKLTYSNRRLQPTQVAPNETLEYGG